MKSSSCGLFELLELDSLILFVEIFEGLESSEERVFPLDDIMQHWFARSGLLLFEPPPPPPPVED